MPSEPSTPLYNPTSEIEDPPEYEYYVPHVDKSMRTPLKVVLLVCAAFCCILAFVTILNAFSAILIARSHHKIPGDEIQELSIPWDTTEVVRNSISPGEQQKFSFSPDTQNDADKSYPWDKTKLKMCLSESPLKVQAFAQVNMLPIIYSESDSSDFEYTEADLWSTVELPPCSLGTNSVVLCSDAPTVYITVVGLEDMSDAASYALEFHYTECTGDHCDCSYLIGASIVYSVIVGTFGSLALCCCCCAILFGFSFLCVVRTTRKNESIN